jgi:hypothetical protein
MKLPRSSEEKVTIPVGLVGTADVSVTVAVHNVSWLMVAALGTHDTFVPVW